MIIVSTKKKLLLWQKKKKKKGHPDVVAIALCESEQISGSSRRVGFSLCGAERLLHSKHSEMRWRGER